MQIVHAVTERNLRHRQAERLQRLFDGLDRGHKGYLDRNDWSDAVAAFAGGSGAPVQGLALGGEQGIAHVLHCLLAEADLLMAVDGYPTIANLDREALLKLN